MKPGVPGSAAWIERVRQEMPRKIPHLRLKKAWAHGDGSLFLLQSGGQSRRDYWAAWNVEDAAGRGALTVTRLVEDPRLDLAKFVENPLGGRDRHCEVRVLSYKPGRRCSVLVRTSDGDFIAKTQRPGDYAVTAHNHRAAQDAGLDFVLHPTRELAERSTLVWRRAAGDPLRELLKGPGAIELLRSLGTMLGSLHGSHPDLERAHSRVAEVQTLDRWVGLIERWEAGFGRVLRTEQQRLAQVATAITTSGLVASHRDLHDGQILVAAGRVRLMDLDTCAWAEPELDLGNVLAHLDLSPLAAFPGLLAAGKEGFLEAYAHGGGRWDDLALSWYTASAYLRMAAVHRFRPTSGERVAHRLVRRASAMELTAPRLGDVTYEM